jgi:anti-anti-sigma regulatory factor
MDTSGLRLVVHERQRAEADGCRFVVVRGPAKVQRLVEVAGFPPGDGLFVDGPPEASSGGGA